MQNNPSSISLTPPKILLDDIVSLDVKFFDFNKKEQTGIIEVHKSIEQDIRGLFDLIHTIKFPLESVQLMSDFHFDDDASMAMNNTSAFNFRTVTLKPHLVSNHGYGVAIDINPMQNPYIKKENIFPPDAAYDTHQSGTLVADDEIVKFMKSRGYTWGGDWEKPYLDYMHFHKELPEEYLEKYQAEISKVLLKRQQ
ncbi:peptidase M15 [Candidatus Campbellbacteria bacterium]|nr:peptidase M15 [Candidatus Campbellbacteria bacterium]